MFKKLKNHKLSQAIIKMSNGLNFHKEVKFTKNYNNDQSIPYINISNFKSDSSNNLQVESSHFSLKSNNNKNNFSLINNKQILNNNIFISSASDLLSFSKSISNSNRRNNSSIMQMTPENLSLHNSNKLQNSYNSNHITKNSIFYSSSTLCNYYQKSNDITPNKSPLIKGKVEVSNNKKSHKLKQNNYGNINKENYQKKNIKINNDINNFNIEEIILRNDECSLDCKKSLSSHKKQLKRTPIKYAKNQLQSGDKSQKSANNSSSHSVNKNCNNIENFQSEISKDSEIKNGRNLMDAFEKIGNNKENFNFFNNKRQPTEINLISPELIEQKNNNNKNIPYFIEKLQEDNSFLLYKNINSNVKEEKITDSNNYLSNFKGDSKIDEKFNKIELKKIEIQKILPINKKKYNVNMSKLSKTIIKELSRSNIRNRKENMLKKRSTSFTKNLIININSFNSINNSNISNKDNKKIQDKKIKNNFKNIIPNLENYNSNRSKSFTKFNETNTNLFERSSDKYIINKKIDKIKETKIPLILNLFTENEKSKKNKLIPIANSKKNNNPFISNELKELTNNNNKNYQTFSAWPRVENSQKTNFNEKRNLINNIHVKNKNNNNIIHPILNKEKPKLNVIQNFSSYHKIKYQNVNFA